MKDNLVTLAIHTFQKAQILKMYLESEGIEVYLHNVNLIQPVVSSGVRVRIKESDLPAALKLIEENPIFQSDDALSAPDGAVKKILIPVDFSAYSVHACEIGFSFASTIGAEIVLFHAYMRSNAIKPLVYNESFFGIPGLEDIGNDADVKRIASMELQKLEKKIREKIAAKLWPDVKFSTKLTEGIPEEAILDYSRSNPIQLIVMGTRGKDQKDIDLIGSVTADVINQTKIPVLAIPENTPFHSLLEIKKIAFGTSFDQKDLIAVDFLINMFKPYDVEYYLFHLSHKPDAWDEIKLGGIKEYFLKQYPNIPLHYEIIDANNFLLSMERFVSKNQIDLISLATHKRNLFTRLFNPSVAHKMLFHTDTPVLVFHP